MRKFYMFGNASQSRGMEWIGGLIHCNFLPIKLPSVLIQCKLLIDIRDSSRYL